MPEIVFDFDRFKTIRHESNGLKRKSNYFFRFILKKMFPSLISFICAKRRTTPFACFTEYIVKILPYTHFT